MTIDKEKLKSLAEAAIKQHQEWVAAGEPWPVWNSYLMELYGTANPAVILALLAEIERLTKFEDWFVRLDQVEQSLAASFKAERDQLKAENEDYKSGQARYEQIIEDLKAENEALRKDAWRYRWLRDKQTFIWLIQDWFPGEAMLTNVDADIDAAMAKEASHDR